MIFSILFLTDWFTCGAMGQHVHCGKADQIRLRGWRNCHQRMKVCLKCSSPNCSKLLPCSITPSGWSYVRKVGRQTQSGCMGSEVIIRGREVCLKCSSPEWSTFSSMPNKRGKVIMMGRLIQTGYKGGEVIIRGQRSVSSIPAPTVALNCSCTHSN